MEYVFHTEGTVVRTDGTTVIIQADGEPVISFPTSRIQSIDFSNPDKFGNGSIEIQLFPEQGNPNPNLYSFILNPEQLAEARTFEQGLRNGNEVSAPVQQVTSQNGTQNNAYVGVSPTPTTPSTAAPIRNNRITAIIAAAVALVLGAGMGGAVGWGLTQQHANSIIAAKNEEIDSNARAIENLQTTVNSLQMQLAYAQTEEETDDTWGSGVKTGKLNEWVTSGGIDMKVTEVGEQPTISFDTCGDGCSNGEYAPKKPDENTKYWVAHVEVTNNGKKPINITCSYPYEIVAVNSDNQQYTPIDNIYDVEGNPMCTELQPGMSTKVTYPFQVPLSAKMVAIAFRDVGDFTSGNRGEDDYTVIVTDDNYHVK